MTSTSVFCSERDASACFCVTTLVERFMQASHVMICGYLPYSQNRYSNRCAVGASMARLTFLREFRGLVPRSTMGAAEDPTRMTDQCPCPPYFLV